MVQASMVPEPCRVVEVIRQTSKEVLLVVEAPRRVPFDADPGQFVMVSLPGIGEGTPEGTLELLVRKVGRLTNLVTRLVAGDLLYVRGPYGRRVAWDQFEGSNLMLIAGGLGLAPLRPFVRRALLRRERFRHIDVLIGARNPDELLFRDDLASWKARRDDVRVLLTVDAASDGWGGRIGVITTLFDQVQIDTEDAVAVICGPPVMYRHAIRRLLAMGFYESRVWLTLERRMKCGVGLCGNCQMNGLYLCQQGPLFSYREVRHLSEAV
jgi:sulfhydrogenase subunit gamma (sulfur reductase)